MQINQASDLSATPANLDGVKDVLMKVLIGQKDGSRNIIMRHFTVLPGGHTPLHTHPFEHVAKVEKGRGVAVDQNGQEHPIASGHCLFIPPNEKHQFKNPHDEPFEFLCIIPNPDK